MIDPRELIDQEILDELDRRSEEPTVKLSGILPKNKLKTKRFGDDPEDMEPPLLVRNPDRPSGSSGGIALEEPRNY